MAAINTWFTQNILIYCEFINLACKTYMPWTIKLKNMMEKLIRWVIIILSGVTMFGKIDLNHIIICWIYNSFIVLNYKGSVVNIGQNVDINRKENRCWQWPLNVKIFKGKLSCFMNQYFNNYFSIYLQTLINRWKGKTIYFCIDVFNIIKSRSFQLHNRIPQK